MKIGFKRNKNTEFTWKSKEEREREMNSMREILLLVFLAVLVGLVYLACQVWEDYKTRLMQNQYDQLSISVELLSSSVENSIREYEWDYEMLCSLETMPNEDGVSAAEDIDEGRKRYLQYLTTNTSYASDVFWMDGNGTFLRSLSGAEYSNPVLYTETDQGISIYQMENADGHYYLVFMHTEAEGPQMCMTVDAEAYYQDIISNVAIGTNGYILIKNSEGLIIMHPERDQWGIHVIEGRRQMYPGVDLTSLEAMIDEQNTGKTGISEYDSYWWLNPDLPLVHKIAAYTPADLGGDFWVISAVEDYDDIYDPIRDGFTSILYVFLAIILLFCGLFLYMAKLMRDRQRSSTEIQYLHELNDVLEEVHQTEDNIAHQQRLQIMGTMTGGIAHEFNNFLTPIMGYAEILMMEFDEDSEAYDSAREIYEASEKAKDVVRQISSLSRKNVETVYKSIPARQFIQRAVKMLTSICPAQIRLDDDNQIDADTCILGNSTQLNQVILNIGVNAVHAIGKREGGVLHLCAVKARRSALRPDIAARLRDTWENYIEIRIRDNGCGMDPETMKHIFDPFFTTKKNGEGTGLGLALAEQIISSHKGYIYAESTPGIGSTFYLFIPVLEGNADEELPAPEPGKEYRIVIADDNAKVLEMLEKSLTKIGVEVITCKSVQRIKEHLAEKPTDVLFIDETLRDGTGVEVCMSLQGMYPHTKKIVMADQITRELAEARQRGIIDGYVEKPVSQVTLLDAVRRTEI